MKFLQILNRLKDLENINKSMLDGIYDFTPKIVFILMGASAVLAYLLYPTLGDSIIYWGLFLWIILTVRLYSAYSYRHHPHKYSLNQWYLLYIVFAFLVASYVSSLSILFLTDVGFEYQLYMVLVLLGLSLGSTTTFPANYRLGILYLSIILFPLLIALAMLGTKIHYALIALLLLNASGLIGLIRRNYQHEIEFSELLTEHKLLDDLFKEAPNGIFIYDNHLNILDCNEEFLTLFQNDREFMIGFNLNNIENESMLEVFKKSLSGGFQSFSGEYTSLKGKEYWLGMQIYPYTNRYNKTIGSIVLIDNKTNEHLAKTELTYLADHDVLTGLFNRRGFHKHMEQLVSAENHQTEYSLVFYLDLNQFKGINDSLGHSVGDAVLLNVSSRLKSELDDTCKISRLGGDEFIIVYSYVSSDENDTKSKSERYAEQINSIFDKPFIIEDLHLHISASIGVIIIEPKYQNIEEIVRHADITMYHAKTADTNISYYNEVLDVKQKELFVLQHDLAYAVDKNEFDLYFQPIVKIKDEKLYAAEALIRWRHPERGLLGPDAFVPLAIKAGLLSKITWWVMDEVCKQILEWKSLNLWKLDYISININAQQLIENNFAEEFLRKLKSYELETQDILVEITERSLIDNFDSTQNVINALRKEGVRCAIDDFGIGYSSLSYLKKLSFNTLKIDREFVREIESNPRELLLVSTILDIGRQFNYNIVIEGVEDKKQKDLLLGLDEDLSYQGFYFSKPLQPKLFKEKFLDDRVLEMI